MSLRYLLIFILSIKGTLLLALLARNRWSIAFFRICTPLAFATNKRSNGIAIFASRWLAIGFYILLTFFTYSARVTLSVEVNEAIQYNNIYFILLTIFIRTKMVCFYTYMVCWNSDLQYVHFTTGKAPLHSYMDNFLS